jgi:hypothetical protein
LGELSDVYGLDVLDQFRAVSDGCFHWTRLPRVSEAEAKGGEKGRKREREGRVRWIYILLLDLIIYSNTLSASREQREFTCLLMRFYPQ